MNIFDQFALNIFNHYKPRLKKKTNTIVVFYMSLLQCSLLLLLGVFFSEFFNQMKVETMSSSNAWTLFVIASLIIYFKNWMVNSGKRRMVLNAKSNKKKYSDYNVWILWLLPLGCIALSLLLLNKF
ncbi:hypothetical protein [Pontimicrobium sp. SW4]|uniref:DUF4271 domain-containing protein n=1 Tax=Pontimicrobium sp. SW4 TaxID=3153519 RepID=A0AAU7BSX8_9FLAO